MMEEMMSTLLVIEENPTLGQMYAKLFTDLGISVTRTTTCDKTLTYLKQPHIPDIILLDLGLLDGTGMSILHYLRSKPKRFIQTQVIIMTNGSEVELTSEPTFYKEHIFYKPVALS